MIQGPGHLEAWCIASGDPHAYYARLLTHPKCWRAYSFRDDVELAQYAQTANRPRNITFDPARDPDAARVFVPGDQTSIRNQERFPLGYQVGQSLLATWDYSFGPEWAFTHTSMNNSKNFNMGSPKDTSHLLWQTHFQYAAPGTLALVDLRGNSPDWPNQSTIPPFVERYVYADRICRAWWFIMPEAQRTGEDTGTWRTFAWFADSRQPPAELYPGGVRFYWPPAGEALGKFWAEYATSQNEWQIPHVYDGGTPDSGLCVRLFGLKDDHVCGLPATDRVHVAMDRGPLVARVRNLVVLRALTYADVVGLLEQPRAA